MVEPADALRFTQLHIDVARNATDDFNPFHDPMRWQQIRDNPFGSTIVLGFQTAFLVSDRIEQRHRGRSANPNAAPHSFSNYDFRFVGALLPDESFRVDLRNTIDKTASGGGLSTRVLVRKHDGAPVLIGTQSEAAAAKYLPDRDFSSLPPLGGLPDRQPVPGSPFFLKRKFLMTSNAKNFVLAGLARQQDYFDELSEYVAFPPMFCASFASCGLLEKASYEGYDFLAEPVVYATHQISVDRRLQVALRSNERLHVLVEGPCASADGRNEASRHGADTYHVFGLLDGHAVLFRARLQLVRLSSG